MLLEDRGPPNTSADKPRDDSVQMRGKRRLPSGRRRLGSTRALHDTDGAAPILEEVEDVALAELDPDRTPFDCASLQTLAYRSMPRHATVSGTPRSAQLHTCPNAGPTIRTRWPPFFRQR